MIDIWLIVLLVATLVPISYFASKLAVLSLTAIEITCPDCDATFLLSQIEGFPHWSANWRCPKCGHGEK